MSEVRAVLAETPGACTLSGGETFSPGLGAVPTDETVSINLTGTTCETSAGPDQVTVSLSGVFLMALASGVGSLGGQVVFSSSPPVSGAVTAVDVSIPTGVMLAVTGSGFDGVIVLAAVGWPLSTTSASLTGTFVFNSA